MNSAAKRKSESADDVVIEKKPKHPGEEGSDSSTGGGGVVIIPLKGFYADRKGERDEMQDAHSCLDKLAEPSSDIQISGGGRLSYYAIFDGHAGAKAARFAAENLHRNWIAIILSSTTAAAGPSAADLTTLEQQSLKRCFIEAYKKTDEQFLSQAVKVKPVWKDGTTSTALFVINNAVYVTNLGDSKAILCRYKQETRKEVPIVLTKDHNPTIFEERMRIQKAGGSVKDGRVMGMLEVSRSIGDGQYKNYGVTCIPDIKKCVLTENDRYILIGCDGLWKSFTNQQVVDYVSELREQIWKDESILGDGEKTVFDARWEAVCQRLVAEAVRKGSGDNVTVLVVVIGGGGG